MSVILIQIPRLPQFIWQDKTGKNTSNFIQSQYQIWEPAKLHTIDNETGPWLRKLYKS